MSCAILIKEKFAVAVPPMLRVGLSGERLGVGVS